MNVMRLSDDPGRAAFYHPDVTGGSTVNMTGRMCYEATHVCSNALRKNGWTREWLYGKSHYNHPICEWAGAAYENFEYVRDLGLALNEEYKRRTNREDYASVELLLRMDPDPSVFPRIEATEQPQCFGEGNDNLKREDPVAGYREYYRVVKGPLSEWIHVPRPAWLDE
jgi:hypothetical protein